MTLLNKAIGIFLACVISLSLVSAAFCGAVEDNNKGIAAMNAGNFEEAIGYLAEAYRFEQDNLTIKQNLIMAYNAAALESEKKDDFDKAYKRMKQAFDLAPQSNAVKRNFACLLTNESGRRYQQKNRRGIVGLLKESLEYDDTISETHVLIGQAYYDEDDYSRAQKHWEKALLLDPARESLRKKLEKLDKEMKNDNRLLDTGKYHFKVRYEGVELWRASNEVLDMLEDACKNAGWKLGIYPQEPVTVIIYTAEQFRDITGRQDWYAGVYDGKIRLRRKDVEGDKKRLKVIVYHEYMHAFIHFVAGGNVPSWLHEGVAQCYENMPEKAVIGAGEKQFLKDRLNVGMPGLDSINQVFASSNSQEDVQFAYLYAKSFVAYMIEKGWDYNIKYLLEELAGGSSVDQAFDKVYFRNLEQMRSDWLESIRSGTSL